MTRYAVKFFYHDLVRGRLIGRTSTRYYKNEKAAEKFASKHNKLTTFIYKIAGN